MVHSLSLQDIHSDVVTEQALIAVSDINGFARFAKNADPTDVAALLRIFARAHTQVLADSPVEIIKYMGDGCLMLAPSADSDAAVHSICDMRESLLAALAQLFPGAGLGVKVQIHVGQVFRLEMPPYDLVDVFGQDVNATFLLAAGQRGPAAGEIILSPQAFRCLDAQTRKRFHRYTPPQFYRGE